MAWQYAIKTGASVGALLVVCSAAGFVTPTGLLLFAFGVLEFVVFVVFVEMVVSPHPTAAAEIDITESSNTFRNVIFGLLR